MAVQTETYANIQARVEALMGDTLTTTERTRLNATINRRARLIYKRYDKWPSFFVGKAQRRVNGESGIEHVHTDTLGADLGQDHIDEMFQVWGREPFNDVDGYWPLDIYQTGDISYMTGYEYVYDDEVEIATLVRIQTALSITTAVPHGLKIGDKIKITGATFLTGEPDPNQEWTIAGAPDEDSLNVFPEDGFVGSFQYGSDDAFVNAPTAWCSYRTRIATTYGEGAGQTANVPNEFAEYLTQGGYADTLRADGQTQKAAGEEMVAETILNEEMWRHDRKLSEQTVVSRIESHATRAYR